MHLALGFRIERRGRLVEQQNWRILQHGARDGEALALAARELHAKLADRRLIALGQIDDEVVGGGGLSGGLDLGVGGARPPVGDIGAHRVVEQGDLLADQRDLAVQGGERQIANIEAVDRHPAAGRIVEAQDQVEDSGFPRPRRSHQGNPLSGRDHQVDAAQGRRSLDIGKVQVFERNRAGRGRQIDGARFLDDLALDIEHRK